MKKYRITLTEAQLQNLNVFLDAAVRARGLEAAQPALEIVRAAHEAEEIHEGNGVDADAKSKMEKAVADVIHKWADKVDSP